MDERTISDSELGSEQQSSLTNEADVTIEFSSFVDRLSPVLCEMKLDNKLMGSSASRKAIESLEGELERARALLRSPNVRSSPARQVEDLTQNLGRSLGLVLFSSRELLRDKEKIEALRKEMMHSRFIDFNLECETEFCYNDVTERQTGEIVEVDEAIPDSHDVFHLLKYGDDDELKRALLVLNEMIRDNRMTFEGIDDEEIIKLLLNRLSSTKANNRLFILKILRRLIANNDDNKEKMAEAGSLSPLVKSLARDAEEQRATVEILVELSELPAVKRRVGRIRGCIVMLVAILNGDDQVASEKAGKLLNALSGNTQYALHMAEAGYFRPLVQCLSQGSEMSKILMATALSRMEFTEKCKASLGEDGAIQPLVKMFTTGNLEAKLSSLSALQSLSSLKENTQRLVNSGVVATLLQLLFSVTSVVMILREPASSILAKIAQSESILVKHDIAQQMLSLLNLSSPVIQCNLLEALNNIAAHPNAVKVRRKLRENGAIQVVLPFIMETNIRSRTRALRLIYSLCKDDVVEELTEQLDEKHIMLIADIISSSKSDDEKAAAAGVLGNLPLSDKKMTFLLKNANLLPVLVSILSGEFSTPTKMCLAESVASLLVRFTVPSDKKLQIYSAEHGVIPVLVKLLSSGSELAKCRSAKCLSQLSQNSVSLLKSKKTGWFCVPPSGDICEVHGGSCSIKSTFCLVKAGAVPPLIQILESRERGADEEALACLATLLQDAVWENGCNYVAKFSCAESVIKILEIGSVKAQELALWMLERVFRIEIYRAKYGETTQGLLIDLAQNGDAKLKPAVAKLLAQLELLQVQSSYF